MRSIISIVYVLIGFFVASGQGYFMLDTLPHALSFAAAVVLWPLLFLGVNLRF